MWFLSVLPRKSWSRSLIASARNDPGPLHRAISLVVCQSTSTPHLRSKEIVVPSAKLSVPSSGFAWASLLHSPRTTGPPGKAFSIALWSIRRTAMGPAQPNRSRRITAATTTIKIANLHEASNSTCHTNTKKSTPATIKLSPPSHAFADRKPRTASGSTLTMMTPCSSGPICSASGRLNRSDTTTPSWDVWYLHAGGQTYSGWTFAYPAIALIFARMESLSSPWCGTCSAMPPWPSLETARTSNLGARPRWRSQVP